MKRTLAGKIVLITGGTRGLGLELARKCLSYGAKVAICSRYQPDIDAAMADLGAPNRTLGQVADVTDTASLQRLLSAITARWGGLDVLINNAAVFVGGPMASMTPADYRHMLDVNVMGTITLTELCLPLVKARPGGGIITIASGVGILPVGRLAPYAVSKAAIEMYTQQLEAEQATDGFSTLTVYPGYMSTPFPEHADFRGDTAAERARTQRLVHAPLISVTAEQGARRIVRAWLGGRRVLIYPWLIRLGAAFRWIAPHLVLRAARRFNRRV